MRTRRVADEQGAVAVIVALLMVIMLGLSAFAIDFGAAFNSKRELQISADAAAIGAASVYATAPGNCGAMKASAALRSQAQTEAEQLMQQNHLGASASVPLDVFCDAANRLNVRWTNNASMDTIFGGVFGVASIDAERTAVAMVGVASEAFGMRPYAVCSGSIPASFPSAVTQITYNGDVIPGPCPGSSRNANWWSITCPDGSGGTDTLADNTEFGCPQEVSIVPGQEPYFGSPSALSSHLISHCPSPGNADEDCLAADPGNIRSKRVRDAWDAILGDEIVLPVFCGEFAPIGSPTCAPPAVTDPGGSQTQYPVHRFVGVQVCGWHWGNQSNETTVGDCAGADASPGGVTNYLLFVFKNIQVSGSIKPSDCALGSSCDGGVRQVNLVE